MNMRELAGRVGVAERQIRYMIAEGFVPPPTGGRANADYGPEHVEAIEKYISLKRQGFPPQAIRRLMAGGGTAVPFPIAPGLTLQVDPTLLGPTFNAEDLVDRLSKTVREYLKEQSDADSPSPEHRSTRPSPRR